MAVFVAAADESGSGDGAGEFYFGGYVAPQRDWDEYFAPVWQERVLNTKPSLKYFHTTELKSAQWRHAHSFREIDAERKIDEAIRVISRQSSLYPITVHLNASHFKTAIANANVKLNIKTPGGVARKRFDPDYLCFVRFVLTVLLYVRDSHADAEKVDFVVEVNGQITKHLQRFHASIASTLRNEIGRADLADLVGTLIPAPKERVPLQAADLFCWFVRNAPTLDTRDMRRLHELSNRAGHNSQASEQDINEFAERAAAADIMADDPDFEGVRGPS